MPDDWEALRFSDTTTVNGKSDCDRDGYTDLQDYLNWANTETDPAEGVFDPKLTNASSGIGYVPYDDDFWTMMIPVILNSGRQQWDTPGASFVGLGFMREFEHNLQ
jgi:hypothetical protein